MNDTAQSHLIIVGGGLAGLVAANRAAQLGLRALVLEQGDTDKYLCNSRYTGGTLHIAHRDIMLDEAELMKAIEKSTYGFVAEPLARAIATDGRRFVRWLQAEGARFLKASASEHHNWVLAPPGRSRPGLDWEGRAGDVLLRTLEAALVKRGGRILRSARAHTLLLADAACTGVEGTLNGAGHTWKAPAVVIADGGFQNDAELVGTHVSRHPDRLMARNAGTARGDGLRMAQAAGAALVGMDRFYGHLLSRDAFTNPQLWPYPYLDTLATAGVVVNGAGRRFADEGRGGVYIANQLAKLDDPLSTFVLYDCAIWEGPGRNGLIPPNPHLPKVGGTVFEAPTLEALARACGLLADETQRTVDAYNAALAGDALSGLQPKRTSAGRYVAQPIATPPYYAVPMCAGLTYTMGGIAVDDQSRALDAAGHAIPGLYAAGGASGGFEGGPEVGYVGGLVRCGVTGLRAAERIAAAGG